MADLRIRIGQLREIMSECRLCPRACGAKRFEGKHGVCQLTNAIVLSSVSPHDGEELRVAKELGLHRGFS